MFAAAALAAAASPFFSQQTEARVVCRTYTEGNQRVTEFCNDGYLCDLEARKCRPGPEARRKQEAERAKALAEARKRQGELRKRLQEALKANRRAEPPRPAAAGQNPFNCSYKPAGGGAAWDAMCLDTVMSDPQKLAALRCNPGEICPRGAGGIVVDNSVRQPAARQTTYTAGTYTPGTWSAPSDDWRRIPSPQYHRGGAPQPPAYRQPSLREQLKVRMRYREAEKQVDQLIAERNKHARGSAAWTAMNDVLKGLGETLAANGLDLSATFNSQGVYGGGEDDVTAPESNNAGGNGGGGGGSATPAPGNDAPAGDQAAQPSSPDNPPPGDQQAATPPPEPDKPKLSSRDEVYCSFVLYRVHQNDLAYRSLEQIPEPCRTDEMKDALAAQQQKNPTIIFDASDRAAIERMTSELDDAVRAQLPPGE